MDNCEKLARPVVARVSEMPENYLVKEHQHNWGQLAYSSRGIMKVEIPGASFIIPPERALWIPKNIPHVVSTKFGLSFRSLYIENDYSIKLPNKTTAINVDKLLRELILRVASWGENYRLEPRKERHLSVLLDQIESASQVSLSLVMPTDKRLIKIIDSICKQPSDKTSLEQWSQKIGATPRTINRLFQKETQMGFIEWRQRLRILYSLELLEKGDKVSNVAIDLGYESGSAFITMFKKHLGLSPKRYFKTSAETSIEILSFSPESSI